MITKIRKIFKMCAFDPKPQGTTWHIAYRDLPVQGHIVRAKQLINFYHEGAVEIDAIHEAIWHLACALVKHYASSTRG